MVSHKAGDTVYWVGVRGTVYRAILTDVDLQGTWRALSDLWGEATIHPYVTRITTPFSDWQDAENYARTLRM